ncbi:MAG: type II/IV secretion system ATPase subunit [Thermoplasmatales archaeon]|nr:MAG: type II/IV secretion system ATPase subunit [Thermoplasmatales archaeon]
MALTKMELKLKTKKNLSDKNNEQPLDKDHHNEIIKKLDSKIKDEDKSRKRKILKIRKKDKKASKEIKKTEEEKSSTSKLPTTGLQSEKSYELRKKLEQEQIELMRKQKEVIAFEPEDQLIKYAGKVISRKTGFGWKGLGSRRIVYDNTLKEHIYQVLEPSLNKEEEEIKNQMIYFFRVRSDVDVFGMDEIKKREYLKSTLDKIMHEKHIKLSDDARDKIYYYIFQEFVGYGKIDILMHDGGIEDISCDGINIPIFVYHKDHESIRTNIIYKDVDELNSFVVKLSQLCGKQISVYEPVVDGKLEDGSRLQTTLGNTITKFSTFTIRRFREDPLTPIDLIENNTMNIDMAAYFWMAIEKGTSILFCGGTASGKTTALNALSLFLPSTFKIVSIEDTREINLPHENWIAGTTRTGFASTEDFKTGKDIDMFDLIRVALRQRPRVIIVGEVRGKEAYTLFQAMTTGHLSYSTVHASDMHTLIQRLENKPIELPRALLTSLDLIVFLNSVTVNGMPVRRITNVTEVIKLDPESNRLVTLTPFHWISEVNDTFENTGGSRIINHIKLQNGWTDKRVQQELENRKNILKWMMKKQLRSYEDVGDIVSDYIKDPESILTRVREDT